MHIEQNAPPGASGGHGRLAPDPWANGTPPGYEAALAHLQTLGRKMMEAVIAGAIDALDAEDAEHEDLEPDLGDQLSGETLDGEADGNGYGTADDEASLGAAELVTCPTNSLRAVRKQRARIVDNINNTARVDRSCDQSKWSRGPGGRFFADREEDTTDDEPSLASPEIPASLSLCVNGKWGEYHGTQENWASGNRDDGEDDAGENVEALNEDGGDINDQPQGDPGCAYGTADAEPSLGWREWVNQASALKADNGSCATSSGHGDDEPSLASVGTHDQRRWSDGRNDEAEAQCDDEGAMWEDGA